MPLKPAKNYKIFFFLIFIYASCSDNQFKHTQGLIEYKIIHGNSKSKKIKYGDAIRYKRIRYYDDSILVSPYDHISQIAYVDSLKIIPEYVEILTQAREGDSIVTRILVDSLSKYQPDIPSYARKGKYVGLRMKLLSIIEDKTTAEVFLNDAVKQMVKADSVLAEKQKINDDKILADFISSKKIKAIKTSIGTYVEIESDGTGSTINKEDSVTLNFTATTLEGRIFSTTYDSINKIQKPFRFQIDDPSTIQGLNNGIKLFKKGGKGKLFVPSALAFGVKGAGIIKPNECVIYEIEILDVRKKVAL